MRVNMESVGTSGRDAAATRYGNAVGLVELSSIAAGFGVADAMLKSASVEILVARTICSGKYMVLVGGEVQDVRTSVETAVAGHDLAVVDYCVIASLDPQVIPAIAGNNIPQMREAFGVIESFSVAALIEAADAAVKTADVDIVEIRLAMALGGKAFVTMTGDVAAVTAAVEAGSGIIADKGLLVNKIVIPNPRPELLNEVL